MKYIKPCLFGLACCLSVSAHSTDVSLSVEIPALNVTEYHRPYLAIWIQNLNGTHQGNLAVWYDQDMKNGEGTKWLKDLRLWWRRDGRRLDMPVDAFTSATRPTGTHLLDFSNSAALSNLKPGSYEIVIEAAREVGGRELISLPFEWPATSDQHQQQQGQHELGLTDLKISP